MLIAFEGLDEVACDIGRLGAIATVEPDLPTAGLVLGERNVDAQVPEHFDGRHADFWKELIHEAGSAECDPDSGRPPLALSTATSMPCHKEKRSRPRCAAQAMGTSTWSAARQSCCQWTCARFVHQPPYRRTSHKSATPLIEFIAPVKSERAGVGLGFFLQIQKQMLAIWPASLITFPPSTERRLEFPA